MSSFWQFFDSQMQFSGGSGLNPVIELCSRGGNVRQYRIDQDRQGRFFISEQHTFSSIEHLVFYHKHNPGGQLHFIVNQNVLKRC